MIKAGLILLVFVASCYCLEDADVLFEDGRAKKKKSPAKLIGMILLFMLSKVAIFKAVSVFLMMTLFQKLFAIAGIFLQHYMKRDRPAPVYGSPQYDTVGYSYGPPDEPLKDYPGNDLGSSFDWLLSKNK
ncbi:uncharacterized protein LOC119838776 [Zerene cesonia]|uniref:uncharacterized protein LOC119838776 n=1 Tax=Zerene cesonia TaxID=33412 RepID=UPI0018E58693|nr:uncharacterized protein LOC119838776 [Zerene cesonia]